MAGKDKVKKEKADKKEKKQNKKSLKAQQKEAKKLQKQQKKEAEARNRMLISVSKATRKSMGLLSVHPEGIFRMDGDRWIRVYRINGIRKDAMEQEQKNGKSTAIADCLEKLHSAVRLTWKLFWDGKKEMECFLTLTGTGQVYDEVRTSIIEDERLLERFYDFAQLGIDEVLHELGGINDQDDWTYASLIRAKKDWKKEIFPKIEESKQDEESYVDGELAGGLYVMQFPVHMDEEAISVLGKLKQPLILCMDINGLRTEEQIDYRRLLEKQYNRHVTEKSMESMNASLQMLYLADSQESLRVVRKTILLAFARSGFVLGPMDGSMKKQAESMISLGLMQHETMRDVTKEVVEQFCRYGGTYGSNSDEV